MGNRRLDPDDGELFGLDALRPQLTEIEWRCLAAGQQHRHGLVRKHHRARPHVEGRALGGREVAVQIFQMEQAGALPHERSRHFERPLVENAALASDPKASRFAGAGALQLGNRLRVGDHDRRVGDTVPQQPPEDGRAVTGSSAADVVRGLDDDVRPCCVAGKLQRRIQIPLARQPAFPDRQRELHEIFQMRFGRGVVPRRDEREGHAGIVDIRKRKAGNDVHRPHGRVLVLDLAGAGFELLHGAVGRSGARRRPHERRAAKLHPGHCSLFDASRKEARRADRRLAGVGVRVLAIADEPVRVCRHGRGECRVEVEDPENRQFLRTGHGAKPAQELAFEIVAFVGDGSAMQAEPDPIERALAQRLTKIGFELPPEPLEDCVVDHRRGKSDVFHRRRQIPPVVFRHFEEAVDRRGVTAPCKQIAAMSPVKIIQRGSAIHEGMGFVKEPRDEHPGPPRHTAPTLRCTSGSHRGHSERSTIWDMNFSLLERK